MNKLPDRPLEIVKPIYGGPAYSAGLLSGDRILKVDGAPTAKLGITSIVEKLQGPAASAVTLQVMRRGWLEPREFVIERRKVEVPSVHFQLLPGKIPHALVQFPLDRQRLAQDSRVKFAHGCSPAPRLTRAPPAAA